MRLAWISCVAMVLGACLVYDEELLEPENEDGSGATAGGVGGATSSSSVGGMGATSATTATSAASTSATTATSAATTTTTTTAATTTSGSGGSNAADVWINELHYDNDGGDLDEGVEVGGPAGTDLSRYQLVFYNGSNGATYDTEPLVGTIPDQQNGYGTVWFPVVGLQNGSPDGVVLAFGSTVLQFVSYEGSFTATAGVASGMSSTDIGVAEEPAPLAGATLQLVGAGHGQGAFTWASSPVAASLGQPNAMQTLQ